ncbi:MAG: hypothetical protein UH239_08505 [Acutalibacteraceae bacterium]|nr:hypothetical protein [Acutalibacteraceae bacterium]
MNMLYFRLAAIFTISIFILLWTVFSNFIPKAFQYVIAGLIDIMCIVMLFAAWESRLSIGCAFSAATFVFGYKNLFPGSGNFSKSVAKSCEDKLEERRGMVSMLVDYMFFVGCIVLIFEFMKIN